jgi:hypothetical protein
MNELCVEHCSIKRDCSGFEEKPNLKLADMPHFPNTEGMSREEKFTSVTIYLAKVVDSLQGTEDEYGSVAVHRPQRSTSSKPKAIAEVAARVKDAFSGDATK